ncbi:ABC transporter substrate-binding protein [Actinophytocola sp.]|uniref:ABC transporter substrate-binding protein n=1 Tax=Actinophytocola sp. TaxID=1872138 RepID=UPI003D6AE775
MSTRHRRRVACGTLALLAGLATAGCGPDPNAEQSAEQVPDNAILIGLSTPLSGSLAGVGEHNRWGAELAVEEINAAGGINGRPLGLVAEDNACNPAEGANVATRFADNPDVVGILGAFCSSVTLATMPVVLDAEVPLVIGVSSTPDITEQSGTGGNDWAFRITPSDTDMAIGLAKYLSDNEDVDRISYVAEDSDYGRGGAQALIDELEKDGVEVASTDYFAQGTTDFSTILAKVRGERPDMLAIFAVGADDVNFAKQFLSTGMAADISLTGRPALDLYEREGLLGSGDLDSANGVMQYSAGVDTPENKEFVAAFTEKFDQEPVVQSFHGYLQAKVLADAIERAGSADRAAVREALETTDLPSPLGGRITFDEHNQAYDHAVVRGVKDGEEVVLDVITTSPGN